MKRLVTILLLCLCASAVSAGPFSGKTKHRPVNRMSRAEVRRAQKGITLYTSYHGKIYKNSRMVRMTKQREEKYAKMFGR